MISSTWGGGGGGGFSRSCCEASLGLFEWEAVLFVAFESNVSGRGNI